MTNWQAYVREQLGSLHLSPERESEIVAEIALQLEQATNAALARGASATGAETAAVKQFPNWRALANEIRAAEPRSLPIEDRAPSIFAGTLHDLRHAFRMLRRNPMFAFLAICTLAFGIGANSAIFTIVDALALKPIPYQDPSRLVALESLELHRTTDAQWVSMLDMFDLRDQTHLFSAVAGISPVWNDVVTIQGNAERLQTLYVSASFFPMLGVNPIVGRMFTAGEDKPGAGARVAVLSYAYWQRQFGGDRNIIGQPLNINDAAFTIIGVAPQNFHYLGEPLAGTPGKIDLWFPLATNQIAGYPRYVHFLKVIAQLKREISAAQASEEVHALGVNLAKQFPDDAGYVYDAAPLANQITGRVRPMMLLLLGAVGLVLVMACANVANLLLTVAIKRGKEIAVRAALGASRFRLMRQFLSESFVLAGAGTIAGIALSYAILRALLAAAPITLIEGRTISLDRRAILFTIAAAITSAILAGLPPALRILRGDIASGLRETARGFTGGHHRFRAVLVVAQVSSALALVIGAGLLIRGFARLLDVNPGFDPAHVATVSTLIPASAQTMVRAVAMDHAILDRISQVPGVRTVGMVSRLPLLGSNLGSWLWIEGKTFPASQQPSVEYRVASANYFSAMGIPLRSGRGFDQRDAAGAPGTALINEKTAERYWPGDNPVGQRIKLGPNPEKQDWIEVIGVVGDVHHFGLDKDVSPEVYRPLGNNVLANPVIVARVEGNPGAALQSLAAAVHSVDPGMPVYDSFPLEALVERSTAQRRFLMLLLTGFAASALLLAAIGIYGTISQSVAQRTRELGLRMALGASQSNVLVMILNQGLRLAVIGIAIGGIAAAVLTRLMRSVLFEVAPLDSLVFTLAALTLGAVAIAACLAPALRATRVDPLVALRHEE